MKRSIATTIFAVCVSLAGHTSAGEPCELEISINVVSELSDVEPDVEPPVVLPARFDLPAPVVGLDYDPGSVPSVIVNDFAELQAAVNTAVEARTILLKTDRTYTGN